MVWGQMMFFKENYWRSLIIAVILIIPSTIAYSKNSKNNQNYVQNDAVGQANTVYEAAVYNRSRPQYDPLGIRLEGFMFYPYASLSWVHDDNVLSSVSSAEQDDNILKTKAGFHATSDWGRHMFGFGFEIEDSRYDNLSSEDHTNIKGDIKGRLDIYHDLSASASFSLAKLHEGRGSSDAPSGTAQEPTPYNYYNAQFYIDKKFSNSKLQIGGSIQNYDYEDVPQQGGGVIDQDTRDGYVYTAVLKKLYNFSPGYSFFGIVDANFRDFESTATTTNRDSSGLEVRAGIEFEVTRLMAGEFSLGYLHQDYDNTSLSDIEDLAFKVALLWNPTQLMTVNLNATRVVSETTVAGASGHLDTTLSAKVDYEILRNLIGSPYVSYVLQDFEGTSREDEQITAGLSIEYLINRRLRAKSYYSYTNKDSSDSTFDYDKNTFGGEIKLQF